MALPIVPTVVHVYLTHGTQMEVNHMPSLDQLAVAIAAWQRDTMPDATAYSSMAHLRMEVEELDKALEPPFVEVYDAAEEAADIFFMLIQVCDRANLSLPEAVLDKYLRNLDREWQQPDAQGKVHHT